MTQFATIARTDGSILSPCVMLDVSATGAQIQLNDTTEIPDELFLVLSRNGEVRRRCRVVRREEHKVGVQFILASTST